MTKQEAIDKINKKVFSRPEEWKWREDSKRFGFGSVPKKPHSKRGYQNDKEYRKEERKYVRMIRHKVLFHIPITEADRENYFYYLVRKEITF